MWSFLIPPPLRQSHSSSRVQVHAGYSCVSIIHRTLTWATGSFTCVHGLSYACVYTQGLGTPTASQHSLFDSEKVKVCFVPLTGFEPSTFGSTVQRSNHWANPSPPCKLVNKAVFLLWFCLLCLYDIEPLYHDTGVCACMHARVSLCVFPTTQQFLLQKQFVPAGRGPPTRWLQQDAAGTSCTAKRQTVMRVDWLINWLL